MAGVLSFKSISYSQNLVLAKVFWAYFSSVEYSNLQYKYFSFSKVTPLEYGVVLKRTEIFVFVMVGHYACSPWIRLANWISFGMMVTRLA